MTQRNYNTTNRQPLKTVSNNQQQQQQQQHHHQQKEKKQAAHQREENRYNTPTQQPTAN